MGHPPTEFEIGFKREGVKVICAGFIPTDQPNFLVSDSQILAGKPQLQGFLFRIFENFTDRSVPVSDDELI